MGWYINYEIIFELCHEVNKPVLLRKTVEEKPLSTWYN